jgi:hypothetical protein
LRVGHRARVFGGLRKAAADIEEGPCDRGRAREVEVDEAELADVGKEMGVLGSIALRLLIEVKREREQGTTYDLVDVWSDLSGSDLHCHHAPQPKTFGC